MNSREETLLIHLGGLGDICLSETTFLSMQCHFGGTIRALGSKRVLDLFRAYFIGVESIDEKTWVRLFSDPPTGPRWQRIIFIGKDRAGSLRERLGELSSEVIFIDMYPDGGDAHVEEYQLAQLARHGIMPARIAVPRGSVDRVLLYPERPFRKRKWPVDHFVEAYLRLKDLGIDALLMGHPDLRLPVSDAVGFEDLRDVEAFFAGGGVFFSNDSGMAHFAARCGLRPLTLFWDADPFVWRPRNGLVLPCGAPGPTVKEVVDFIVHGLETFAKDVDQKGSGAR